MSNEQEAKCGKDHKYNGWTNYETWCVALWIDNEEGAQRFWDERAREILADPNDRFGFIAKGTFKREDVALTELADELKESIEDNAPDLGASMFSDLLNAALSEVDWREIASHYIDAASESAQVQS